jgi:hypothetical protein
MRDRGRKARKGQREGDAVKGITWILLLQKKCHGK